MSTNKYDVGVIVGRFQVPYLHEGHIKLISSVLQLHDQVIIALGLSPCLATSNNPLDYETRRLMICDSFPQSKYPGLSFCYIDDFASDTEWSKKLDSNICKLVSIHKSVILYGGRDSFISRYTGKYECKELLLDVFMSGSSIRQQAQRAIINSQDFRAGVIWATAQRYDNPIPTVDAAILDFRKDDIYVLLAKKEHESKYRFIGGFCNNDTLETNIRREIKEEAGIEVSMPIYICSHIVDDWRYRNENNKILTTFFACKYIFGKPTAMDDICELKWFKLSDLNCDCVVSEHQPLVKILFSKIKNIQEQLTEKPTVNS